MAKLPKILNDFEKAVYRAISLSRSGRLPTFSRHTLHKGSRPIKILTFMDKRSIHSSVKNRQKSKKSKQTI